MAERHPVLEPHGFHLFVALAEGERHGSASVRRVLEPTSGGTSMAAPAP